MRLKYPKLAPEGYAALSALQHYVETGIALEPVLMQLVYLRASQLNGCDFCMGLHAFELEKHNEPESRIHGVADWRGSDAFTPRERAALAWTESVTEVHATHVSDEDYAAVSEFFTGKDLVDLTMAVATINAWNRLGVAFRVEWNPGKHAEIQKAKSEALAESSPEIGTDIGTKTGSGTE